jgi:general secretion pathway protein A
MSNSIGFVCHRGCAVVECVLPPWAVPQLPKALPTKNKTMYQHMFHFFDLRENPFHVSPDPRFFFSTPRHNRTLAELSFGINTQQGFIVLEGEAGTGKTILLHHLLNSLRDRQQSSCYIFQSQLKPLELFESVLRDFGVPFNSRRKSDLLAALNQWLVGRHALGDSPVLIIDEAQSISLRTLDRLRMLLNLEMPGKKLLQVVLAGQPELEVKLRRPELRHLNQRVMFRSCLEPLSSKETAAYVKYRLEKGGAKDTEVFPDNTLEAVHAYAQGIPRVVNLLCEHALIDAFGIRQKVVVPDMIHRVAAVFDLTSQPVAGDLERVPLSPVIQSIPVRAEGKAKNTLPSITPQEIDGKARTGGSQFIQETCVEMRAKPEGPEKEAISLAAAAVAAGAIRETREPPALSNLTIAAPAMKIPIGGAPKRAVLKGPPIRWRRPTIGDRFMGYWRGVEQSFVRDCKRLLQTHSHAKTELSSSTPVGSGPQRNILLPIASWLKRPMAATRHGKNRASQTATAKLR